MPVRCDALGCAVSLKGRTVAFVYDPRALAEDCRTADIVIASVPVRAGCRGPQMVVDRFDLWRAGAHAIWFESGGKGIVKIETGNQIRGSRPWVPIRSTSTRQ